MPGRMRLTTLVVTAFLSLALAGCLGRKAARGPVFFPPAPNPPRVQYLKGVSDSRDVLQEKTGFSLFSFGQDEEEAVKNIAKPYGILADKDKVYVVDTLQKDVAVMDLAKRSFHTLAGNKGPGRLKKPVNVAVGKDGTLFVADTLRKEIVLYDAQGNYLQGFGKEYEMKPVDVAVDQEHIYALDFSANDIKVLDRKSGKLLRSIGKSSEGAAGLSMPTSLAMDANGFLYVTNTGSGQVVKLDQDGHIISSFGKIGDGFAEFGRPRGIAVDHQGRIYVVDASHQNVQIFNDQGRLLMFFGDPGYVQGSLSLPAGVSVTRNNLEYFQSLADPGFILESVIFVTNQYGPVKVAVYGLGQMKGSPPISNYQEAGRSGVGSSGGTPADQRK